MKLSVSKWQLAGFAFTGVTGVLLHFLFDWSGGNILATMVSAGKSLTV